MFPEPGRKLGAKGTGTQNNVNFDENTLNPCHQALYLCQELHESELSRAIKMSRDLAVEQQTQVIYVPSSSYILYGSSYIHLQALNSKLELRKK